MINIRVTGSKDYNTVKIYVQVQSLQLVNFSKITTFWAMMPCSSVPAYQSNVLPPLSRLILKMKAAGSSKILVYIYLATQHHFP